MEKADHHMIVLNFEKYLRENNTCMKLSKILNFDEKNNDAPRNIQACIAKLTLLHYFESNKEVNIV